MDEAGPQEKVRNWEKDNYNSIRQELGKVDWNDRLRVNLYLACGKFYS